MNCKQGDLAVVVKSMAGNEGKIVRCVERYAGLFQNPSGELVDLGPSWLIDPSLPSVAGCNRAIAAADDCLRPIRDPGDDATDETLIYAGAPNSEVTA